jgi:aminoglycoside phosphotransferase (APT) family kinase protein
VGAGAVTPATGGRIIAGVPSPLARLLPEAVPPALRACLPSGFSLAPAHHGESAAVAFVEGEGEPLVLKRATDAPYAGWLVAEAEVLRELAGTALPVPRVRGVCHDGQEAWLLLTRLPGEPVIEALPGVPEAERPAWFRRLGGLLGAIHTTPVPPALRARDSTPWWHRPRPVVATGTSREVLSATRLDQRCPPAVFVHGDFTLDNVLADANGPSGVVDWGGAGRGDPRYDVALALLSAAEGEGRLPAPACVRAFYDGYLDAVAGVDPELHACFSVLRDGG